MLPRGKTTVVDTNFAWGQGWAKLPRFLFNTRIPMTDWV